MTVVRLPSSDLTHKQALNLIVHSMLPLMRCVLASALHPQFMTLCCAGATLIVSPAAILTQWRTEIAKHTHPGALLPDPKPALHTSTQVYPPGCRKISSGVRTLWRMCAMGPICSCSKVTGAKGQFCESV